MSGYSISARIIHRGIQVTKNSKAIGTKYSWNNRENFGYLVITRTMGNDRKNGKCK